MESTFRLDGVGLITGAASGIGKAISLAFALSGCSALVLADINEAGAGATADECKKRATHPAFQVIALAVDVTQPDSVQAAVDRTVRDCGRVDYLVHSAGVTHTVTNQALADTDLTEWDRVMAVNTRGTMLTNRAVTRAMVQQEPRSFEAPIGGARSLGRGAIVNLASVNGQIGMPGHTTYNGSKHAVLGMTKVAAIDNIAHQIRVNAVCPAFVQTPMMDHVVEQQPFLPALIEKHCPLGRAAQPDEIANAVVFLCSPAATYVNGSILTVDAGLTLTVHAA